MGPDKTACAKDIFFFPFSIYVYWNKTIQSYNHACSDSCICCLITCLIDSSVSYRFLDFFLCPGHAWTSKFACPAWRKHHPAWNVRSIVASLIGCIQVGWVVLWYFLALFSNNCFQWAAGNPSLAGGMGVVQIALFQAGQAITRWQFCTHSFLLKSSGNTVNWNDLNTVLHIKQLHSLRQKSV